MFFFFFKRERFGNPESPRCVFSKNNVLRKLFAARFRISNFIPHASAIDIIWETGFFMAQLWPSFFSLLLPFIFSPQPVLSRAYSKLRFCTAV